MTTKVHAALGFSIYECGKWHRFIFSINIIIACIGWGCQYPYGMCQNFAHLPSIISSSHWYIDPLTWSTKVNYLWLGEELFDFPQIWHITSWIDIWVFTHLIVVITHRHDPTKQIIPDSVKNYLISHRLGI